MKKTGLISAVLFLLSSLSGAGSVKAVECDQLFSSYDPQNLNVIVYEKNYSRPAPIVHTQIQDWFLGWVALDDAGSKTGFKLTFGLWQEVEDLNNPGASFHVRMSNMEKNNTSSFNVYVNRNLSGLTRVNMIFDGRLKHDYKKRGGGRIERWSYLTKRNFIEDNYGTFKIGFSLSSLENNRFRKDRTLILKTSKGRPRLNIPISLMGYVKARKFLNVWSKSYKTYQAAYKAYEKGDYKKGIDLMRNAKEATEEIFSSSYMYFLKEVSSKTSLANFGITDFDYFEELGKITAKYPSANEFLNLGLVYLEDEFDGDEEIAISYFNKAAAYGEARAHEELMKIYTARRQYKEALSHAKTNMKLGGKVDKGDIEYIELLRKGDASKCAWQLAHNTNEEHLLRQALEWYGNAAEAEEGRNKLAVFDNLKQAKQAEDTERRKVEEEKRKLLEQQQAAKKERLQKADSIWKIVGKSQNVILLKNFIADYPESQHVETAKWLLKTLQKPDE